MFELHFNLTLPEGFFLDHGVAEGTRDRICWVAVGRVSYDVELTTFTTEGVVTEPDGAVGEPLAVVLPVSVAAPAIVDGISGEACGILVLCLEREHLSLRERGIDAPAKKRGRVRWLERSTLSAS